LLNEHCSKQDLTLDKLPVKINQNIINVNKIAVICSPSSPSTSYLSVQFGSYERILLYDEYSEVLGQGGQAELRETENNIKEGENTISFYLDGGHGVLYVSESSVVGRGTKTAMLDNGDTLFINYDTELIGTKDPRLFAVLEKFSSQVDQDSEELYIDKEGYDEEIYNTFFNDLDNISEPEKSGIIGIENILSAVESN